MLTALCLVITINIKKIEINTKTLQLQLHVYEEQKNRWISLPLYKLFIIVQIVLFIGLNSLFLLKTDYKNYAQTFRNDPL